MGAEEPARGAGRVSLKPGFAASAPQPLRLRRLARIAEIPAAAWDGLFDPAYPFTRHVFLDALERCGCVGAHSGWEPCHTVLEDAHGRVLAAAPLYRKRHSYGEFVFDWAWAAASERLHRPYYPKLTCAVPFTPVAGPRIGAVTEDVRHVLARRLTELPDDDDASSLHALFLNDHDRGALVEAGAVERLDVQFQWDNRGYRDFNAFAAALTSEKRKKILRERRRVREAGIRFEVAPGAALNGGDWDAVYALYANTYAERGRAPYLTREFLEAYGGLRDGPLHLILAYDGAHLVAVALVLIAGHVLYGRHWGAAAHYHSLHFETCYYQGIELAIRSRLRRFDAGTQGAHKLARGFLPVTTRSAHVLSDERLATAVAAYLEAERREVEAARVELTKHSPYRGAGNG